MLGGMWNERVGVIGNEGSRGFRDSEPELAASFLLDSRNPLEPSFPITPTLSFHIPPNMANQGTPKEIGINKPTPFTGDRQKVNSFIQECNIYLTVNKGIYNTDEAKIAFILSYLTDKVALQW